MDSPGTASDSDTATDHSAKTDELEEINVGWGGGGVQKAPHNISRPFTPPNSLYK